MKRLLLVLAAALTVTLMTATAEAVCVQCNGTQSCKTGGTRKA
jgi:hypothetical protein